MSPLEGDGKTSPPLVALLVQGWQVLPSPGEVGLGHTWCIGGGRPGSTWNSLLVGRVKAVPLLAGIRLVTSHPSPFGTGEHRANAIGEGALPMRTRTRLTERKVLCPNRYQHLPVSVGGWGTYQEPGTGADTAQPGSECGHAAVLPWDVA